MLDLTQKFLEKGETLVCFGDSITAAQEGYVSFLQKKLPENKIINAGVGGDKTATALTRFKTDVLAHKPDALSIYFGANDAIIGRREWGDEPLLSAEAYRTNLIWMVHIARLNGIKKISIATPLGEYEGDEFNKFGNILETYCLAARHAADEMHTSLVGLDSMFVREWRKNPGHTGLLLTRDGIHPTAEAHKLISEEFIKSWNM